MNDKDQDHVSADEVVGVLAPEVSALTRELDAMRHASALQEETISKLQESVKFADKELFMLSTQLMVAENLMRTKQKSINELSVALLNSRRSTEVATHREAMANGELRAICEYLAPAFDEQGASAQGYPHQQMTALDMVHKLVTAMEVKAPMPQYNPKAEITNALAVRDAEQSAIETAMGQAEEAMNASVAQGESYAASPQ